MWSLGFESGLNRGELFAYPLGRPWNSFSHGCRLIILNLFQYYCVITPRIERRRLWQNMRVFNWKDRILTLVWICQELSKLRWLKRCMYLPEMLWDPQLTFSVHAYSAVRLAEKRRWCDDGAELLLQHSDHRGLLSRRKLKNALAKSRALSTRQVTKSDHWRRWYTAYSAIVVAREQRRLRALH